MEHPNMHILPVMDVKQGVVVRGVAGERHRYQPVTSLIAADSQPVTVARALAAAFGFRELYLADLDAIAGELPDWTVYERVAGCGFKIILDAGIADLDRCQVLQQFAASHGCLSGIVLGLESVASPRVLVDMTTALDPERAVFSLDLKNGQPITRVPEWKNRSPLEIASMAIAAGFRRLIVLDLASVGMQGGPNSLGLCRALRKAHPQIEIVSGGGVRSAEDVRSYVDAGCHRVLVASALHDGSLASGGSLASEGR